MKLKERLCPVCQGSSFRIVAPENFTLEDLTAFSFASRKIPEYMHFRLLCCDSCTCVYASPAPGVEEIAPLYKEASYDSGTEARYAAQTYYDLIYNFSRKSKFILSSEKKILDIGAGDGAFLSEMYMRGFKNLFGVEPSSEPLSHASEEIRPLIRNEIFSINSFPSEAFDLITLFQTIEHLHEPRQILEEIFSRLNPGGIFCVACHNFDALSRRILGTKSPIFDVEHLQLFGPRSIHALFEKVGFKNIKVASICNTYPLRYWYRLLPIPMAIKVPTLKLMSGAIGSIPIRLPAGNMFVTGVRE